MDTNEIEYLVKTLSITSARDSKFRQKLIEEYGEYCMVTGSSLAVEAAHIIPVAHKPELAKEIKNAVLLNACWHWLFDLGKWKLDIQDGLI